MAAVTEDWVKEDSNLYQHALRELKIAGMLLDPEQDGAIEDEYNHMVAEAVLELQEVFARQRHSGFSASMVLAIFTKVAAFDNLTPITNDPAEWFDHGYMGDEHTWQCIRNGSLFSNDGGKTYHDVNEERVNGQWVVHTTLDKAEPVT